MYKYILLMVLAVMSNSIAIAGNLEDGIGAYKKSDYSQALELLRPIAENGNVAAQGILGRMYLRGEGVTQDYEEAAKWHRLAAEQGDPLAIGNLGMLYVRGDGVPVNQIAGFALLLRSVTLDSSPENNAKQNITSIRDLTPQMITVAQELDDQMSTAKSLLVPLDQYLILTTAP